WRGERVAYLAAGDLAVTAHRGRDVLAVRRRLEAKRLDLDNLRGDRAGEYEAVGRIVAMALAPVQQARPRPVDAALRLRVEHRRIQRCRLAGGGFGGAFLHGLLAAREAFSDLFDETPRRARESPLAALLGLRKAVAAEGVVTVQGVDRLLDGERRLGKEGAGVRRAVATEVAFRAVAAS